MKVLVHKFNRTNGGCITEIISKKAHVFFCFGSIILNDEDQYEIKEDTLNEFRKGDCIFMSSNHGYNSHLLYQNLPDINFYFSKEGKEVSFLKSIYDDKEIGISNKNIGYFENRKKIVIKDITITPFKTDNIEVDSYMFLIESEGKKFLHTGSFKAKGFQAKNKNRQLQYLVKKVDALIVLDSTIDTSIEYMTERDVQLKTMNLMDDYKFLFVICSSKDIDRIGDFYNISISDRPFITSPFIKACLEVVQKDRNYLSSFYRFKKVKSYREISLTEMRKKGFLMVLEPNSYSLDLINKFDKEQTAIVYSMWDGYLKEEVFTKPYVRDFLKDLSFIDMHTKGDNTEEDIKEVINVIRPLKGIILLNEDDPFSKIKFKKTYQNIYLKEKQIFEFDSDNIKNNEEEIVELDEFDVESNFAISDDNDKFDENNNEILDDNPDKKLKKEDNFDILNEIDELKNEKQNKLSNIRNIHKTKIIDNQIDKDEYLKVYQQNKNKKDDEIKEDYKSMDLF